MEEVHGWKCILACDRHLFPKSQSSERAWFLCFCVVASLQPPQSSSVPCSLRQVAPAHLPQVCTVFMNVIISCSSLFTVDKEQDQVALSAIIFSEVLKTLSSVFHLNLEFSAIWFHRLMMKSKWKSFRHIGNSKDVFNKVASIYLVIYADTKISVTTTMYLETQLVITYQHV